jgi:hypothetical protein
MNRIYMYYACMLPKTFKLFGPLLYLLSADRGKYGSALCALFYIFAVYSTIYIYNYD